MTSIPKGSPASRGSWDELVEIVLAVGVPKAFRPKRAWGQRAPHGVEWLDEARAEARRAVLERATFERLGDCTERPEHLLALDVGDAVWSFDPDDGGRFEQWSKIVLVPEAGFAARVGDVMLHGEAIAPGPGSPDVFIGGRPALRSCDSHVSTRAEPTAHAGAGFVATYARVEINGFPALRVGDYVDEGPRGCDAIAVGCPTVVIGPKPRPVEGWRAREAGCSRQPNAYPFRWRRGQPGPDQRTQVLGAELDGPRAWAEGTARAVRLWAEAAQEDEQR